MAVIIRGIDIPKKHHMNCYYIDDGGKVFDVSRKNVVGKAVQIPSEQPEPERGFWYPIQRGEQGYSAGDFRCSICGQPNHCSHVTKYCCSCGAKMER